MPPTNAQYAKINIACKQLGIDKYDIIADRYGIESTKQLTHQQTFDLMLHFKALGWQPTRKKNSKASPKYKDAAMRKVVAIWITLYQKNVVKNPSDKALQAFVKRQTGMETLLWCDRAQVRDLIETLKQWAIREGVDVD
jgi:phage gp16-like protein